MEIPALRDLAGTAAESCRSLSSSCGKKKNLRNIQIFWLRELYRTIYVLLYVFYRETSRGRTRVQRLRAKTKREVSSELRLRLRTLIAHERDFAPASMSFSLGL